MSVTFDWYVADRVVMTCYEEVINAYALSGALAQTHSMIEGGKPPVYALIDATRLRRCDLTLREMRGAFRDLYSARCGGVVIYGAAPQIAGYLMVAYTQITDRGVRSVRTLNEARALINRVEGEVLITTEMHQRAQ